MYRDNGIIWCQNDAIDKGLGLRNINSVKKRSCENDSGTWYQDRKIRIRNTRIPDRYETLGFNVKDADF